MKHPEYRVLKQGLKDASQAPRGDNIFYRREISHDILPSAPKTNIRCKCRNIAIDVEYNRLLVQDFSKFTVLERIS
jgi:hypothetical protein